MKFVVDENLPWRAAAWIASQGHTAQHISELGLLGQPDAAILAAAARIGAHIVTRDADFIALASGRGEVGIVHLLIGNCPTAVLLARLEVLWPEVEEHLRRGQRVIEIG